MRKTRAKQCKSLNASARLDTLTEMRFWVPSPEEDEKKEESGEEEKKEGAKEVSSHSGGSV